MKIYVGMKFRRNVTYFKDLYIITGIIGRTVEFKSLDNPLFRDRWSSVDLHHRTTEYLKLIPVIEFKDYLNKL